VSADRRAVVSDYGTFYNGWPPHVGNDTSRAAAEAARPEASSIRSRVRKLIERSGDRGMTCDEVEAAMKRAHQSVSARVRELAQDGHIVDSGRRRKTRAGRDARVYVWTSDPLPLQERHRRRYERVEDLSPVELGEAIRSMLETLDGHEQERLVRGALGWILELYGSARAAGWPPSEERRLVQQPRTLVRRLCARLRKSEAR
jgi:hypothetical protein